MIATPNSLLTDEALTERESAIVLHQIPWELYQVLRGEAENRHLRMTYDGGELEIMSPSRKHEQISELMGLMICQWALAQGLEFELGGNTTFSRRDLARGLEPDHCFWFNNQAAVRGKDTIDLGMDPPLDLALEVEVSHSTLSKLPIYQALSIPEVWRWCRGRWEILVLNAGRDYESHDSSTALPSFPLPLAEKVLARRGIESDSALIRSFMAAMKPS